MPKMIQIRNVPDAIHGTLKARAAKMGMSLSDYLLSEMRKIAETPSMAELRERMRKYEPIREDLDVVRILREERESH